MMTNHREGGFVIGRRSVIMGLGAAGLLAGLLPGGLRQAPVELVPGECIPVEGLANEAFAELAVLRPVRHAFVIAVHSEQIVAPA